MVKICKEKGIIYKGFFFPFQLHLTTRVLAHYYYNGGGKGKKRGSRKVINM